MTKFMVEKGATGILSFISLWPEISSRMKLILKDVTEDNKMVLEKLQQNKNPVSVVIFTSAFGWLGKIMNKNTEFLLNMFKLFPLHWVDRKVKTGN